MQLAAGSPIQRDLHDQTIKAVQPVEALGACRQEIEELASSLEFPLKKLYVVDGSTRSAHSNVRPPRPLTHACRAFALPATPARPKSRARC